LTSPYAWLFFATYIFIFYLNSWYLLPELYFKKRFADIRTSSISDYKINKCQDELIKISPDKPGISLLPFAICIGKFGGGEEAILPLKNKNSGAIAFIMEGAFEVEGRLLHVQTV